MPTSNSIQTVEIKDNDVCYEITDNRLTLLTHLYWRWLHFLQNGNSHQIDNYIIIWKPCTDLFIIKKSWS